MGEIFKALRNESFIKPTEYKFEKRNPFRGSKRRTWSSDRCREQLEMSQGEKENNVDTFGDERVSQNSSPGPSLQEPPLRILLLSPLCPPLSHQLPSCPPATSTYPVSGLLLDLLPCGSLFSIFLPTSSLVGPLNMSEPSQPVQNI